MIPTDKEYWKNLLEDVYASGLYATSFGLSPDNIEYTDQVGAPVVQPVVYIEGLDDPDGEPTDDNRWRLATVYQPSDFNTVLSDSYDIDLIADLFLKAPALVGQIAKAYLDGKVVFDDTTPEAGGAEPSGVNADVTVAKLMWSSLVTHLPSAVFELPEFQMLNDILGSKWMGDDFAPKQETGGIDYSDIASLTSLPSVPFAESGEHGGELLGELEGDDDDEYSESDT